MINTLPNLLALYIPLGLALVVLVVLMVTRKIPFQYSIRNLLVRWKTTAMTATAFTVVVFLLTIMVAFVGGMNRVIGRSAQPANVIVMSDGSTDEVFSNLPIAEATEIEHQPGVVWQNGRPLSSREVYVFVNQPTTGPDGRSKHRFLQIRGLEDPDIAAQVHDLELLEGGHWFSVGGVQESKIENGAPSSGGRGSRRAADLKDSARQDRRSADLERGTASAGPSSILDPPSSIAAESSLIEAVLGEAIAQEFGRDRGVESLQVGDTFDLGPRRWLVVGIMRATGSAFGSEVWAKRSLVGETFGKQNIYTSLVMRAADGAAAKNLADHLSHDYKKFALQATTEPEYYSKLGEASEQLLSAIFLVASIMAIGGVFGVMNTMFAAIAQRASDIGVLRILGFARWQILASFMLESLAIALIGGLLGCILGYLVNGVSASTMVGSNDGVPKSVIFEMVVDPNTLALGLLFTLIMGALGGLLPAWTAMRLRPLESLR
jgi:cell division protein FtsX